MCVVLKIIINDLSPFTVEVPEYTSLSITLVVCMAEWGKQTRY
jgi:hypothetical protein